MKTKKATPAVKQYPTAKHDPKILRRVKIYCAANGLRIQDVYDRLAKEYLDQVKRAEEGDKIIKITTYSIRYIKTK